MVALSLREREFVSQSETATMPRERCRTHGVVLYLDSIVSGDAPRRIYLESALHKQRSPISNSGVPIRV
jgi:hypothetical protein